MKKAAVLRELFSRRRITGDLPGFQFVSITKEAASHGVDGLVGDDDKRGKRMCN